MLDDIISENTMCSRFRQRSLAQALSEVLSNSIAGDFVECGTWRGGLAALVLSKLIADHHQKKLYIYDTFEGMPAPSVKDDPRALEQYNQKQDGEYSNWCRAGLDTVKDTLSKVTENYEQHCVFVVGMVEETLDSVVPDTIALCRLDTDWYESTKKELEVLYPRVSQGGFIIVDDYTDWSGCRTAVNEYLSNCDENSYTKEYSDGSLIIKKLLTGEQ
jgi:O-methyltransferase